MLTLVPKLDGMTYQQTLDFLFSQLPMYQRDGKAAYKDNLDNTHALDTYFDHPHRLFKTIHVAGTNGKGSVSHMLASVLMQAGYKTGLYTSPHLKDFRERIRINGQMISEEDVTGFVEKHQKIIEQLKPSFFEMNVALAFDYFAREQVEVAVIEVGMGGRLDSTNIIHPLLSIITNIGFDHTRFLGHTLPAIAGEKAGIIKSGVPVVIGEWHNETAPVFSAKANEHSTKIVFASQQREVTKWKINTHYQSLTITSKTDKSSSDFDLDLLGEYQQKNILTVLSALYELKNMLSFDQTHIFNGIRNTVKSTGLQGRWQILDHQPLIICDTGHNAEGLAITMNQITHQQFEQLHFVFGVVDDKELDHVFELLPKKATYYFTRASIPRALDEQLLKEKAENEGLSGDCYHTVSEAFHSAKLAAKPNDLIFVGGSTFVVAEVV